MDKNLDSIAQDIAARLEEAGRSRHTPMHSPVVGTSDCDMRVMVLREYDAKLRRLRFHTDSRSPKCAQMGEGARVGVLFYDPEAKIQIRARGHGRIERDGPVADAAWEASTTFARRCYLAQSAPGEASDEGTSGLPQWAEGIQPSEEQVAPARANFAVLLVELERLDWLYLANSGHRRAVFTAGEGGSKWNGQWIVP